MTNRRRDRVRKPGRRSPSREPKPKILIVCEGENTEPQYFEGFKHACRNSLVDIEIASGQGVPMTLVEESKSRMEEARDAAKREKDDNLAYDSVWCVFDVDNHPYLAEACEKARLHGIHLAISNPCFELWLLLHFRDHPGMKDRKQVKGVLKKHVPGYDKSVRYATYSDGYSNAVTRATTLDKIAEDVGTPGHNPTTGVYKLTELIREFGVSSFLH